MLELLVCVCGMRGVVLLLRLPVAGLAVGGDAGAAAASAGAVD